MRVQRGLGSLVEESLNIFEDVFDVVFQLSVWKMKLLASVSTDGDVLVIGQILRTQLDANRHTLQ